MSDNATVTMDQLRVGLYVSLNLKWFEHPFPFSSFKIKTEDQIATIRSLGLKTVQYDPERSDMQSPHSAAAPAATSAEPPSLAAKRALIERIRQQRETAARVGSAFVDATMVIRDINKDLFMRSEEKVNQATRLIHQIADSILSAPELMLHLIADKCGGEEMYFHSLTVTMLSIMMARDIKLPQEHIAALGMGSLFHDIGRMDIPSRILLKKEALTHAERDLYKMHCQYGADIAKKLNLPPAATAIIHEHHEMFDGSGYPQGLKGEQIKLLPRIVVIANYYDELCNPVVIADAMTPHEALSLMFTKLRAKFDPRLLQVFIRCLGVYPPGTIVQLSNGVIGMVTTINAAKSLRPTVLIYDAEVPKEEAILVDLETVPEINITKAIRPALLPPEIHSYLNPRQNVSYYFDAAEPNQKKAAA
jgi:putative nucleotidyltransferase with HDIG domain